MELGSQIEKAAVDLSPAEFGEKLRGTKGLKILDIGSGGRLSISLKKGDLYVMVDPVIDPNGSIISGLNRRDVGSQVISFSGSVEDVPVFAPDLTLIVAPNPVDIIDGDLLNSARPFLRQSKNVLVVLDTRTIEATINPVTFRADNSGLNEAKGKVSLFLTRLGFDVQRKRGMNDSIASVLRDMGIDRQGMLNSGDLGAEKVLILGVRN